MKNLLYCLLLASANEAANVLAMAVSGDIPTFVELMNQRAQELGCTGTHFANTNGLHDVNHYTTAYDMALITRYALTTPNFLQYFGQTEYSMDRPTSSPCHETGAAAATRA